MKNLTWLVDEDENIIELRNGKDGIKRKVDKVHGIRNMPDKEVEGSEQWGHWGSNQPQKYFFQHFSCTKTVNMWHECNRVICSDNCMINWLSLYYFSLLGIWGCTQAGSQSTLAEETELVDFLSKNLFDHTNLMFFKKSAYTIATVHSTQNYGLKPYFMQRKCSQKQGWVYLITLS